MIEEKRISADELQKKIYEKKVGILVKLCPCCRNIRRKFNINLQEQTVKQTHYSVGTGLSFVSGQLSHLLDIYADGSLAYVIYNL